MSDPRLLGGAQKTIEELLSRVAELEAELKSARKSMFRALNDREQLKADNERQQAELRQYKCPECGFEKVALREDEE